GVAPEYVKGLVEQHPLVGPVDKDRVQRPVEVAAIGDADHAHRGDRVDDLAGSHRQPGGAQRTRKMHQIGDKAAVPAVAAAAPQAPRTAAAISALTCSSSRAASLPWMRAMSSWYFRSTPSVSLTASGVNSSTSSCINASVQSIVSAMPGNLNRSILRN